MLRNNSTVQQGMFYVAGNFDDMLKAFHKDFKTVALFSYHMKSVKKKDKKFFIEYLKQALVAAACQPTPAILQAFIDENYLKDFYDASLSIDALQLMSPDRAAPSRSLLAILAERGCLEVLKFIFARRELFKFDINKADDGVTPLIGAVSKNHLEIAALLLEHGADVNLGELNIIKDGRHNIAPAMHHAIHHENFKIIDLLLASGADPQQIIMLSGKAHDWLGYALRIEKYNAYHYLIAKGIKPQAQAMPHIFIAMKNKADEIFKELAVQYHDDINQILISNGEGKSLLTQAVAVGTPFMTQYLLENGANIQGPEAESFYPLTVAACFKRSDQIKVLAQYPCQTYALKRSPLIEVLLNTEEPCSNAYLTIFKHVFQAMNCDVEHIYRADSDKISPAMLALVKNLFHHLRYLFNPKQDALVSFPNIAAQEELFKNLNLVMPLNDTKLYFQELLFTPLKVRNYTAIMQPIMLFFNQVMLEYSEVQVLRPVFNIVSEMMVDPLKNKNKIDTVAILSTHVKFMATVQAVVTQLPNIDLGNKTDSEKESLESFIKILISLLKVAYPLIFEQLNIAFDHVEGKCADTSELEALISIAKLIDHEKKLIMLFAQLVAKLKKYNVTNDFAFHTNAVNGYYMRIVNCDKEALAKIEVAKKQQALLAKKQAKTAKKNANKQLRMQQAAQFTAGVTQVVETPNPPISAVTNLPQVEVKSGKSAPPVPTELNAEKAAAKAKARELKKEKARQRSIELHRRVNTLVNVIVNPKDLPGELYLFGGAVIGLLINRFINDLDLGYICKGKKKVEIENLKGLKFKASPYIPDLFTKWTEQLTADLKRYNAANDTWMNEDYVKRDFTICALYIHVDKDATEYKVIDPSGKGISDVFDKRLRMLGDPLTRFSEDPVQILRAIKYMLAGFNPDSKLEAALNTWQDAEALTKHAVHFAKVMKRFLRYKDLYNGETTPYAERFIAKLMHYDLLERLFGITAAATIPETLKLIEAKILQVIEQDEKQQQAKLTAVNQRLSLFASSGQLTLPAASGLVNTAQPVCK